MSSYYRLRFRGRGASKESLHDLSWWKDHISSLGGKPLIEGEPDLIIFSDASMLGWGATMNGMSANRPWTASDRLKHISELELLAAFHGLRAFADRASYISIKLLLHNTTAISCINNSGGTRSSDLRNLALEIVARCENRKIRISAVHLAGKANFIADYLSRRKSDSGDWTGRYSRRFEGSVTFE